MGRALSTSVSLVFRLDAGSLGSPFVFLSARGCGSLGFALFNLFVRWLTDVARSGKSFRMVTTQKFDEPFAHIAAKIERLARIGAAD